MRFRTRCFREKGKVKFHFAALGHKVRGFDKVYVCNGPISVCNGTAYISVDYMNKKPMCRFLRFNLG